MTTALLLALLAQQPQIETTLRPCNEIDTGVCLKLPSDDPPWVRVVIGAVPFTSMIDLGDSLYEIGKGTLREVNPLLRRFEHRPKWMSGIKAGITAGEVWLLTWLKDRHRVWTVVTSIGITAFNIWAITHNTMEAHKQ